MANTFFSFEQCKLVRVVDGDTVIVDIDLGFNIIRKNVVIRLKGIDTPESRTKNVLEKAAGKKVKKIVKSIFKNYQNKCTIHSYELDKFGRVLGEIFFENENDDSIFLNNYLLTMKYARSYEGKKKQIWLKEELEYITKET